METNTFSSPADTIAFIEELSSGDFYIKLTSKAGIYTVSWIKNKQIKSADGTETNDKVWTTKEGTLIHCQDLTLAHAQNIIRMLINNERYHDVCLESDIDELIRGSITPHTVH